MQTILIVDDNPTNLLALGELLTPHYRVRLARSGTEALRAVGRGRAPDLILLDVMMPEMDGYTVLKALQEDPVSRYIPVIFVTALHDDESEARGIELGAADYLHKPVCAAIALSRIRAQLDAKQARDALREATATMKDRVDEGSRKLEAARLQLMQSEKMASIGQISAGIAHEINNPIGFVASNLGALARYLQDLISVTELCVVEDDGREPAAVLADVRGRLQEVDYAYLKEDLDGLIAETRDGLERVRRIVADMKGFAHSGEADWQLADLHACLESTLNIARNEFKYHCTLVREYGELPAVRCIPQQLGQVFMNLIVNAAQAIEGEGRITVSTAQAGDCVEVRVADTGNGIAPADLPRVFEPFFTTKPVGKGTGLGLSLSREIVARHRGKIEVSSEQGVGTIFTVTLPVAGGGEGGANAGEGVGQDK